MSDEQDIGLVTYRRRWGLTEKKAEAPHVGSRPGLGEKAPPIRINAKSRLKESFKEPGLGLLVVAVGVIGLAAWAQQNPESFRTSVQPILTWSARAALTVVETGIRYPKELIGAIGIYAVARIAVDTIRNIHKRSFAKEAHTEE